MSLKPLYSALLKYYLRAHNRFHPQIVARLQQRISGGLHYTNIYSHRSEWFCEIVKPTDVVLDIACGTGTILKNLAANISYGYGIEKDLVNFRMCRDGAPPNLTFIEGDIFDFDYAAFTSEKGVAVGVLSHILEHIQDPTGFLSRLPIPRLLICVPSEENAFADLVKSLGLHYQTDDTHYREYTRPALAQHLRDAGYSVVSMGFNQEGEIICEARLSRVQEE